MATTAKDQKKDQTKANNQGDNNDTSVGTVLGEFLKIFKGSSTATNKTDSKTPVKATHTPRPQIERIESPREKLIKKALNESLYVVPIPDEFQLLM